MGQRKDRPCKRTVGKRVMKNLESMMGVEEALMGNELFTDLMSTSKSIFSSSERGPGELGEEQYPQMEKEIAYEEGNLSMSSDGLWLYLREIARYPLLTFEDEQRLGLLLVNAAAERRRSSNEQRRFVIEQGEAAAHQLTESNLRLVVSIAKRYPRYTMSLLDSIQDGNLGLMRAVEKFDSRRGYRFSTYATWWIRQFVLRGLAEKDRAIRLPVYLVDMLQGLYRECERLVQVLGREPTEQEIASAMNLSCEKVRTLVKAMNPISLERIVGDGPDKAEFGDFVPDPNANPSDEAVRNVLREHVQEVLVTLSAREQEVLTLRYGLQDGQSRTLEEVGQLLHVTRERIRQIERKAIHKLQQPGQRLLLQDALD